MAGFCGEIGERNKHSFSRSGMETPAASHSSVVVQDFEPSQVVKRGSSIRTYFCTKYNKRSKHSEISVKICKRHIIYKRKGTHLLCQSTSTFTRWWWLAPLSISQTGCRTWALHTISRITSKCHRVAEIVTGYSSV